MTDKEYAKYLFDFLWNDSGADVCSKCKWSAESAGNDCPNLGRKTYDTDLCFAGLKEYAEKDKGGNE